MWLEIPSGTMIYGCRPFLIFGLSKLINFGLGSHEGGIIHLPVVYGYWLADLS